MSAHIVNFKTKKAFKEAVTEQLGQVWTEDPSFFDPFSGYVNDVLDKKTSFAVTNHVRSWFGTVERKNGVIKVS